MAGTPLMRACITGAVCIAVARNVATHTFGALNFAVSLFLGVGVAWVGRKVGAGL